ncbi:MAG: SRPBCC domain-containing protein [Acidimicrobiales bacterium]
MTPMAGFAANAETDVAATPAKVWAALTEPEQITAYMHGSQVTTTWQVGSPITWDGEYAGRSYQDKGEVLTYDEPHVLSVTHYSPMMGQPDEPRSYHTLVYRLTPSGDGTHLMLTQDGCGSGEQAAQFSQNWQNMLDGLKAHVEGRTTSG